MSYDLSEINRILANMIRIGRVIELDEANARVKLAVGGLTTDWLPWGADRAGKTRKWSPPQIGEQIMMFSPYGDSAQGVAGMSIFQDDFAAPAQSKDQETTVYPDGSTVDYNSATNTLTVTVTGSAKVVVNCKEATINAATSVTLDTPDTFCKGKLTVDGLLTYKGGMAGSGGSGATAKITGNVEITGGDVKADDISLKGHGHTEQGDGNRTSNAVA
ncbi:baseplate assembly protein [Serratia phage MQ-4]|nr:baseplate assembly protein [Serratia phage MQ-4]